MTQTDHSKKRILADSIASKLKTAGHQAIFAGGCVRDMLLDTPTSDIDIATSATPDIVGKLFRKTIPVGAKFGVMVVVKEGIPFEVATFRAERGTTDGRHPDSVEFTDAREDALRRDFTINGMFYDPAANSILDYVEGRKDLEKRVIRCIGDPATRFQEDYLRLLRALRFAARLEFKIEKRTWRALCENCSCISRISPERIYQELTKMLTGPHPDRALNLLRSSGLLGHILPEVWGTIGVEQPEQFHPEGDVFVHTVLVLAHLRNPSRELAWAALLHDIGKPQTMTRGDRIRFNNHHRVGSRMSKAVLRRMKASNATITEVEQLIDNHMNFANVTKMRTSTLKRFLARTTLESELELHRADCLASHGLLENYHFLRSRLLDFKAEELKPEPFLGGKDLISLGHAPGPLFGTILEQIYELQLDEQLKNRSQALAWLKKHFPPPEPL